MAGPLPYLAFCGVEVANGARTLEYLRAGLADRLVSQLQLSTSSPCGVLYRVNGGTCGVPDLYVSPAADPAPWYDPNEPGSATFLGVILTDVQGYGGMSERDVAQRLGGLGGGLFDSPRLMPREWTFRALLVSSDDAGAEYGFQWLKNVLAASACDECNGCEMVVRLACPPDDCSDDSFGKRTSYDAALTAGPTPTRVVSAPLEVLGGCRDLVEVEWTIVAGNPWLYRDAVTCTVGAQLGEGGSAGDCETGASYGGGFYAGEMYAAGASLTADAPPSPPVVCQVTAPGRGQVVAPIFVFRSQSGMGRVLLEAYENCPAQSWRFAGAVGTGDPGAGNLMLNAADVTAATYLSLSDTNSSGADATGFVAAFWTAPTRIRLSLASDPSRFVTYQVAGHVVPGGGDLFRQVAVTHVTSSGAAPFGASDVVVVSFADPDLYEPTQQMQLTGLPGASVVTVDCAQRVVTVAPLGDETLTVDGAYLLDVDPSSLRGVEWLQAADCDGVSCFAVRPDTACSGGGTGTTVSIATQTREG